MKSLPILIAITLSATLLQPATARAQSGSGDERYQKRERFPVIRKAFRQIRSDVRYHAGALRDTASVIRHDVGRSIRGQGKIPATNRYGYREPAPSRQPNTAPPTPERRYEEPYFFRDPVPSPAPQPPSPANTRQEGRAAPKIVAPRNLEPEPGARSAPEAPAPSSGEPARSDTTKTPAPDKKTAKKPVAGKIAYPEAKRSTRPGFHYSPFEPFELLDTRGIEAGALAKDPGNGKIFRIPK